MDLIVIWKTHKQKSENWPGKLEHWGWKLTHCTNGKELYD